MKSLINSRQVDYQSDFSKVSIVAKNLKSTPIKQQSENFSLGRSISLLPREKKPTVSLTISRQQNPVKSGLFSINSKNQIIPKQTGSHQKNLLVSVTQRERRQSIQISGVKKQSHQPIPAKITLPQPVRRLETRTFALGVDYLSQPDYDDLIDIMEESFDSRYQMPDFEY